MSSTLQHRRRKATQEELRQGQLEMEAARKRMSQEASPRGELPLEDVKGDGSEVQKDVGGKGAAKRKRPASSLCKGLHRRPPCSLQVIAEQRLQVSQVLSGHLSRLDLQDPQGALVLPQIEVKSSRKKLKKMPMEAGKQQTTAW